MLFLFLIIIIVIGIKENSIRTKKGRGLSVTMFKHYSVLKKESIDGLNLKPDGVYVDCTTGGGGHSYEIAKQLTTGTLICIDKDKDALVAAHERLIEFEDKIRFIQADFFNLKDVLYSLSIDKVDGIIADLGVSSYQIDTAERGFSYMNDGPLDMRMNQDDDSLTAYDVVNKYDEADLKRILFNYGEERNTNLIVKRIIEHRQVKPIETTFELKDIITSCYPAGLRHKPAIANKVFQAIRIEVNGEISGLEQAIDDMVSVLKPAGRISIITFHTLEDRAVKNVFKLHSTNCICPPQFPVCVCHHKADLKLINKKPIIPNENELSENSRSASAKLRIAEKL